MKIYLAPMEGITTYVYRNALYKHYGGIDKYFTPFLTNRNLNHKELADVNPEHNRRMLVIPQILTNQVDVFLEITKRLEDMGYSEVNLNLGCPSGTVVAKKRGAGFLAIPEQLDQFLEAIFTQSPLPISIKTRLGVENLCEWEPLLTIYQKYPIRELTIHTRLQKEFYKGATHPEAFDMAHEKLSIPLCYNGDIVDESSCETLFGQLKTGTPEALMIGRAAIANPSIAKHLSKQDLFSASSSNIIDKGIKIDTVDAESSINVVFTDKQTFKKFHDEILEGYVDIMSGDMPVLCKMKELWVYMGPYRGLSDKQMKQIHKAKRLADYKSVMKEVL